MVKRFKVPVNTVKEFTNQAGTKNISSNTDKLYKEGLELYWGGYYDNALEKFEAVQRLYPNHSEIKKFITNSEQRAGDSKTLWSDYKTIFYIVDGVAALLILLLLIFTFAGKRNRPVPVPATASAPQAPPAPPTIPENTIPDLNGDGKIDVQDIILALQEQQKKQQKKDDE
jgi:hypothetical protein